MQNIQHIFFDLDDTLWDFEKNSTRVLRQLFYECDLENKLQCDCETFLKTYKNVNQQLWKLYNLKKIDKMELRNHRFNNTFKLFNYDNYSLNLEITEQYLSRSPLGTDLNQGCLEALNYLHTKYQLHIITNGFKEVQSVKIKSSGLNMYFKNIITSEEIGYSKPEKKIFKYAEKLANTKPSECVMIGDNYETDIKGALNAGWKALHFNNENISPANTNEIKSLLDLKTIF